MGVGSLPQLTGWLNFRDDYHIIAPDLRGHGDGQWMVGVLRQIDYVYDIAQLLRQKIWHRSRRRSLLGRFYFAVYSTAS